MHQVPSKHSMEWSPELRSGPQLLPVLRQRQECGASSPLLQGLFSVVGMAAQNYSFLAKAVNLDLRLHQLPPGSQRSCHVLVSVEGRDSCWKFPMNRSLKSMASAVLHPGSVGTDKPRNRQHFKVQAGVRQSKLDVASAPFYHPPEPYTEVHLLYPPDDLEAPSNRAGSAVQSDAAIC